jgi:copper transport protein
MRYRWLIGFAVMLLTFSQVMAHANLAHSTPAANASLQSSPQEIRLWFTEPLEPDYSHFTLRDSSGNPVETPQSQIDASDASQMFMQAGNLPKGLYTVVWRAVSAADGHSTQGSFAFGIGSVVPANPAEAIDESVPPESVIVRWLNLLSLSLTVGSIGFWLFAGQPAALEDHSTVRQRWYRLVWFGWITTGFSALLSLLLQTATNANITLFSALTDPALAGVISSTTYGHLWVARMALWGLFGLTVLMSQRAKRILWITLLLGVLILVTQSLFSHASAAPDRAAVANDWLHLVSSGLWIGGLVAFALALLTLRHELEQTALTGRLVASFSNYARAAVALLIVTGLYAAWLQVGSLDALLNTVYGKALLVKGILFLPLLALAAVNLIFTQRGLQAGKPVWVGRLRALVGAEITLTVSILLVVGVMTTSSPARGIQALREAGAAPPPPQPYFGVGAANDQTMHLQITPGYVGENEFTVTPFDENRHPITDATLIRLRFDNLDQNLGESELRPQPDGNGYYRVTGANLSTPGHWRIRMTLARPNRFDTLVDFNVTMQLPARVPDVTKPVPVTERWLTAAVVGTALLGLGGFFLVKTRWPIRGGGLLALGGLLLGLIFLATAVIVLISPQDTPPLNPVEPEPVSINAGYTLYVENCLLCHGPAGKGDGPVGLTLHPRPADLAVHAVLGVHPDGQLYEWITHGYPNSAMPAFAERLSDTDRWNLVNYIRTLARSP